MANRNENKSLFMYTALIFLVAMIIIIIAFFGQTNLQNNQPEIEQTKTQLTGITEKAAILSEENKVLMEQNKTLTAENADLKTQNEALAQNIKNNELLLSSYGYHSLGNDEKALEQLKKVIYAELNSDQQKIYYKLNNELQ